MPTGDITVLRVFLTSSMSLGTGTSAVADK